MESRDERPANANGIEFPLAMFVQHIVEPTKQSEVPQYAATSSSTKLLRCVRDTLAQHGCECEGTISDQDDVTRNSRMR
jgi:hypothetical protein